MTQPTTEQIKTIEQIRLAQTKGHAGTLSIISEQLGGPKHTGCFCGATQWKAFYYTFYTWYDEEKTIQLK